MDKNQNNDNKGELFSSIEVQKIKKLTKQVLIKCARGYEYTESADEYVVDSEGALVLTKRKLNTKVMPPDLAALKLLTAEACANGDFANMSDEQLEQEKQRILRELKVREDA